MKILKKLKEAAALQDKKISDQEKKITDQEKKLTDQEMKMTVQESRMTAQEEKMTTQEEKMTNQEKKMSQYIPLGMAKIIPHSLGEPPSPPPQKKKKKKKKEDKVFLGDFSQMWVGGVADSQTRSKPLKKKPNHHAFFDLNFTFHRPNLTKNPGVGG